jgi:hypothetical protein
MASDIIIRKASKDYVCSCCGHIIRKGEEYLDKVILNTGKIVKHDRYHDECPHVSDVARLFAKIERENGDLICAGGGCKIHIVGIGWSNIGPMFLYREWTGNEKKALPIECAYNLVDAEGNTVI